MTYLLDSGFLYALVNTGDSRHQDVVQIADGIIGSIHLPVPAITEVAYLIKRDLGVLEMAAFIQRLPETGFLLENPLPEDYQRAAGIIRQYADLKLDFVDAIIAAIAERLNITRILTLDHRDFRVIRPRHCQAFELLPSA
jgi:hypothetical protein